MLQRHEGRLQGFECNVEIAQGSVTGNENTSTDSEKALKSAVAQQPVSIIEAVTRTPTENALVVRRCSFDGTAPKQRQVT